LHRIPNGIFVGRTEDGRVLYGKRDPITHKILEIYEWNKDFL